MAGDLLLQVWRESACLIGELAAARHQSRNDLLIELLKLRGGLLRLLGVAGCCPYELRYRLRRELLVAGDRLLRHARVLRCRPHKSRNQLIE